MPVKIALILLAAGNSRRFGSNKLLYEMDGRPMFLYTLEKLAETHLSLTVVTQYETIGETARAFGASVYYNPRPWEGISSSLKIGLRANLDADFALFAVADQPRLSQETLEKVLEAARSSGKGMACASYGGRWGNPCFFSKKYFPELLALTGDRGGKKVLLAHPEDVAVCPVSDPKELADIDTPQQLAVHS